MPKHPQRIAGMITALAVSVACWNIMPSRAAEQRAEQARLPAASINGSWEVASQASGPWLFNLQVYGDQVAGRVWQEGGLGESSEIVDGRIEGDTLTFSYKTRSLAIRAGRYYPKLIPPEPNRTQMDQIATITLTGSIHNDEIAFTAKSDGPMPSGGGPLQQANIIAGRAQSVIPRIAQQMGALGALLLPQFTAKRATTAVAGKVVVDEPSMPRPAFQVLFVDTAGAAFGPVMREVWSLRRPENTIMMNNRPLGSPFDAVPRYETHTLPGNPAEFAARLPAGEYGIAVTGLPKGYVVQSIRSGAVDLTSAKLRVVSGAAPPELTITLGVTAEPSWGRITGKVLNMATRRSTPGTWGGAGPAPATAVLLVSQTFSEFWIAPLRPDGSFEFPRVLPGRYEARAFPDSPITPTMEIVVPTSGHVDFQWTAPDVQTLPCPNC